MSQSKGGEPTEGLSSHTPAYPITVRFLTEDETWTLASEEEVACNLEWFDSSDPEERTEVFDAKSRPVILKVSKLKIIELELR